MDKKNGFLYPERGAPEEASARHICIAALKRASKEWLMQYKRLPETFIRTLSFLALALGLAVFLGPAPAAHAAVNSKYAAIVMDADTGVILHESNADKKLHPASLVKIMTLLMTFDALEQGELRLSDRVPISNHAASMAPSRLGVAPGSSIRVEDAIYALVTKSANDIAVALAEKIGGTESHFAVLMNRKARDVGMTRTIFVNASGLHNKNQVSTARDMARLAQTIINRYPRYYRYFSTHDFKYNGIVHHNHNRLMDTYRGMDGLKTGYIGPSGFNLVASAERGGKRLIGVVFGGRSANSRNAQMATLLDRGFEKTGAAKTLVASVAPDKTPLPGHKPDDITRLAALNDIRTQAGSARKMVLDPLLKGRTFGAVIGEGDYDPADSDRIETGLLAIAAVRKTDDRRHDSGAEKPWAVQIGTFGSRARTDKALREAQARLPAELASNVLPVIVPLKTAQGWLFRGRLSGYSREEAVRACGRLSDCLPIAPQTR